MEHHERRVDGVRLHYVEEGTGPLVLLLHGFPDYWYSWRRQIPALAAAGLRVVAPDLRGYNRSERPEGVHHYRIQALAADIAALVRDLGGAAAAVVGHDWGGVVGWHLAMHHPEILRSLVVLNAPHPVAFRRELTSLSSQPLRSWYAAFFQLPALPEALLSAGRFAVLRRALRTGPARDEEDLERYLGVLSQPGALTAALNYYRAALRYPPPRPRRIELPTLLLWGERDPFLVPQLTEGLEEWVRDLEVQRLPTAAHWLHHSHAEEVNGAIIRFAHDAAT